MSAKRPIRHRNPETHDFKPFILLRMKGFFMSVSILVTPECMMGAEGLNSGRIPV